MTDRTDDAPRADVEVEVGQLWRSIKGLEPLRIARVWRDERYPDDPLMVRCQRSRGGKPMICPVSHLVAHYKLAERTP